jgi:hypothetical protein
MLDRVQELKWLAGVLRESIDEAPADRRSSLAAQYRATLAELESLDVKAQKVVDPLDELAARRAARRGSTSGAGASGRRSG